MTLLTYLQGGMMNLTHVVRVIRITKLDGPKTIYVLLFNCLTGQVTYFAVNRVRDILTSVITSIFSSSTPNPNTSVLVPGNIGNTQKLARMSEFSGINFIPSKTVISELGALPIVTKDILPTSIQTMDFMLHSKLTEAELVKSIATFNTLMAAKVKTLS